jgi:hypothetical protein
MKEKRRDAVIIFVVNVLGSICLIYYAIPYMMHDVTVAKPDAMLALEAWDAAGMALTIGLLPLVVANMAAYFQIKKKAKYAGLLCFLPGIFCIILVASYWGMAV